MFNVAHTTRIDNPASVDAAAVRALVARGEHVVVQFSRACYDAALLQAIDALCRELGEALEVRFYGSYTHRFDCALLAHLPNLRSLSLDCLDAVTGFEALQGLEHLVRLHVGILDLEHKDFLAWPNLHRVSHLTLGDTRRGQIDLAALRHFRQLRTLFVEGHTKNITAIGTLPQLADLTLKIAASAGIAFINELPDLRQLRLLLGGRANLDELATLPIEELAIERVRGFERLDRLERFPRLRRLLIEDQLRLERLSFDAGLPELESLRILNCKQLATLDGIDRLPGLERLRIHGTALDFDRLVGASLPPRLREFAFYTGRKGADATLRQRLDAMGFGDGRAPR